MRIVISFQCLQILCHARLVDGFANNVVSTPPTFTNELADLSTVGLSRFLPLMYGGPVGKGEPVSPEGRANKQGGRAALTWRPGLLWKRASGLAVMGGWEPVARRGVKTQPHRKPCSRGAELS